MGPWYNGSRNLFSALLFPITFILCNYFFVPVSASPAPLLTETPASGPVPLSVQFNITDTRSQGVKFWDWSFGDGTWRTWENDMTCHCPPFTQNIFLISGMASAFQCRPGSSDPRCILVIVLLLMA